MTSPNPRDPLLTLTRLTAWVKEPIEEVTDIIFANELIGLVSVLIRTYGNPAWTITTIPERAADIAILTAKNYYLNPTGNISETVGPLGERKIDDVVRNLTLSETEILELGELAGLTPLNSNPGFWVLGYSTR